VGGQLSESGTDWTSHDERLSLQKRRTSVFQGIVEGQEKDQTRLKEVQGQTLQNGSSDGV